MVVYYFLLLLLPAIWPGISYAGRSQKVSFNPLTPSFHSGNFDEKWSFWAFGRDLVSVQPEPFCD